MNIMRHNGISSLSEMRRLYDLSSPSLSSLGENTFNMRPQAPVYAAGGDKGEDDYIQKRLTEMRERAHKASLERTVPAVPPGQVEMSKEEKWELEQIRREAADYARQDALQVMQNFAEGLDYVVIPEFYNVSEHKEQRMEPGDESAANHWRLAFLRDAKKWDDLANRTMEEEILRDPATCIYTATDNYGKPYRISGNKSFYANPEKYGFKRISVSEVMPGDIVQTKDLTHSMTFNRFDERGAARFNYSRGGTSPKDIVKDGYYDYPLTDKDYNVYRFVGTPADSTRWKKEYAEGMRMSGGKKFDEGGDKIHIKKANRGKFTALKKRTGHSASWFKAHGTPAQKKMAIFALNARKWKHGDGGYLDNHYELGSPEKFQYFTIPDLEKRKSSNFPYIIPEIQSQTSFLDPEYVGPLTPYQELLVKRDNAEKTYKENPTDGNKHTLDKINAEVGNSTVNKYGLKGELEDSYVGIPMETFVNSGIRISPNAEDIIKYYTSYANSPGIERIRKNQLQWGLENGWGKGNTREEREKDIKENWQQDVDFVKNFAKYINNQTVFDTDINSALSYHAGTSQYGYSIVGTKGTDKFPYEATMAHEIAHQFNPVVWGVGAGILNTINTERNGHDEYEHEKHSDKEMLMYLLAKEGIYDSRGYKDCTPEDIAKLRKKYPSLRPLLQMDDEQAAFIINHIAGIENQESLYGNHIGNISAHGGIKF
jgi:hypothetical protein